MSDDYDKEPLSRTDAMRAKCLDCCCWQEKEVKECTIKGCPLHPYRLGSLSKTTGVKKRKAPSKPIENENLID